MSNKIAKELIIIFLLVVVIVFAMGILFYDSITENVEDIIETQYATSDVVNEVLEEIEAKDGSELKPNTSDSLLKSYSINAEDLTGYASENYYESGKKDPFAESSEKIDEHTTTTIQTGTATESQTSNPIVEDTKDNTNSVSNTVKVNNNTNTIKNTVNTNAVKNTTNTMKNTVSNNTNTVINSSKDKNNTVNNISKDKTESSSSKGTFFEDKNSK